jgi:hypothetical protein
MPHVPESNFGTFNWVLTVSRHCRLLSRAMNTLFCPGICQKGAHYFLTTIAQLQQDLEQWRMSIPHDLRPGPSYQCHTLRRPLKGSLGIWLNYLYYSLRLILLRSRLQINDPTDNDLARGECRDELIAVSRSILEMVTYVDVAPSTPLWSVLQIFGATCVDMKFYKQDTSRDSTMRSFCTVRPGHQQPQITRHKK